MADQSKHIPLPEKGPGSFDWWKGQADWSAEIRKQLLMGGWRASALAYCGAVKPLNPVQGIPDGGVRVNIEFEKVEQKRHQLFYKLPALKLRAHPRTARDATQGDPNDPQAQPRDLKKAVTIYREVLSRIVGPKGANTKAAMDEVIFDVLCPSGIGFVKVGYERYDDGKGPMETGQMVPDPEFVQPPGSILGLAPAPMIPETIEVANIVAERYYASRISPAQALIPAEFRGSDYDQADWIGHDFDISDEEAKRRGWTLDSGKGDWADGDDDFDRIVRLERKGNDRTSKHRCREIFYYASRVDAKVKHPDKIRRLVFSSSSEKPIVHEDLKDQKWDERGRLVGGLRTFPIKVLTTRYVSDSAFPPSDCAVAKRQIDELAEFRTQQIVHRRKAVPMEWINIDAIIDDRFGIKEKLIRGEEYYGKIPVSGDGSQLMGAIPRPAYPQENRIAADMILSDINRLFALGANSSASTESGSTTATEIAAIERATATRLSGEREAVVGFWIKLVEALGCLVQLYADREDFIEIVGESGAKEIEAWDRDTIAGDFLYDAVPDSSMPTDASGDRDLALNFHNLVANDPFFDHEQDAKELAEVFGRDPDRAVTKPEPPPPPPPEQPRVNISIKVEDTIPGMPQYEAARVILAKYGIVLDDGLALPDPSIEPSQEEPIKPAPVIDRERLRMSESDNADDRGGGLIDAAP